MPARKSRPGGVDAAGLGIVEIADAQAPEREADAPARGHLHGAGEGHQALVAAGEHLRVAAELDRGHCFCSPMSNWRGAPSMTSCGQQEMQMPQDLQ
jgi:hypothetical protein